MEELKQTFGESVRATPINSSNWVLFSATMIAIDEYRSLDKRSDKCSYAKIAVSCGLIGVQVDNMDSLRDALDKAIKAQMNEGKTTFIEIILNQELGEPFRRDAMKKPVSVAGINPLDMQHQ